MFNDKELSRRDSAYPESQALPHPKVDPRDEMKYDKTVLEGAAIPEELLPVRDAIKIRRKNALTFEKSQYERLLQNKSINTTYTDLFMNDITRRMISVHCGVQTAIQLEIDELDYILNNFDAYFDECENYRYNNRDDQNTDSDITYHQDVIVRN